MLFVAVLFALAASVFAQSADALSPDLALLAKIRSRMVWNLHRQPNYTCVETVEREHRGSPARPFKRIATLRLEVALVNGKEMFGWPGSKSFEDTDLRNIVSKGVFGNGNFANHARAIFEGGFARFSYRGEETIDDHDAVRFDYQIPLLGSGYRLSASGRDAIVGYYGWFYADAKTFDIERIEVVADDIPAQLGLAGATDRMDYARMTIGDGDFLLPEKSELIMRDAGGGENRNRVRFSSCREFAGHSELTFTDAAVKEPVPVAES